MNDYENNNPGQLADLLDTVLPPHKAGVNAVDENDMVQAAARLANAPHPTLSPEAMARIQGRVLQAARQQQAQRRITRLNTPLLRWAAVFVLLFFGLGAAVPSAANSLPGEPLYSVKRSFESIELLLAASPSAKADVYLNQAERRLNESQTLLQRNQFDEQVIQDANTEISQSVQTVAQAAPESQQPVKARAARLQISLTGIVQAAIAAGLTKPEDVGDLLPEATATSTTPPTITPTATLQPSATPTATATITPSLTETAQPTATPSEPPTITPTVMPTDQPTVVPTIVPTNLPTAIPTVVNTPEPKIVPEDDSGVIIGDSGVNVRKGPGTDFEIIAVLQPGTPVQIIGKSEASDWEHVRLADGRAGWISAALIGDELVSPPASNGEPGGQGQSNGNCEHPGNYCNAPGQDKNNTPGDNGASPGNKDHPPGNDNNQGRDSPPNNPGPPDKPPKDKNK